MAPGTREVVSGTLQAREGQRGDCRIDVVWRERIDYMEFLVDGGYRNTRRNKPYSCEWDTRDVPNGVHQLEAVVYFVDGVTKRVAVPVEVRNATTPPPSTTPPVTSTIPPPTGGGQMTQGGRPGGAPPAPVARIVSPVSNLWLAYRRYTVVRRLVVEDVPAGATVSVRCLGRGCAFRSRRVHVGGRARSVRLHRYFDRGRLRPGTRVDVRVTRPATIGKLVRYTVQRNRRLPRRSVACLAPGSGRRTACA
jgi:hypothetical protein